MGSAGGHPTPLAEMNRRPADDGRRGPHHPPQPTTRRRREPVWRERACGGRQPSGRRHRLNGRVSPERPGPRMCTLSTGRLPPRHGFPPPLLLASGPSDVARKGGEPPRTSGGTSGFEPSSTPRRGAGSSGCGADRTPSDLGVRGSCRHRPRSEARTSKTFPRLRSPLYRALRRASVRRSPSSRSSPSASWSAWST